jgi:predicted CopG family antitoxin
MQMGKTVIEIQDTTWEELNQLKTPGDSFDDVVTRLLKQAAKEQ